MVKDLQDAFPESAIPAADGLRVVFRGIPASDFVDPFSDATVFRHRDALRFERVFTWEDLARFGDPGVGLRPKGIVMHPARVGSTLVVACLRCVDGLVPYSEPMAINDLLTPEYPKPEAWTRSFLITALRLVVDLLGRHSKGSFVLKLRSWNCLFADLICEAFPTVPWIFAVRDPLEIGVSLERKPPTWMRTRSLAVNPFLPFVRDPNAHQTTERYFASMFRSFCESIEKLAPGRGLLIRYENLPQAIWESIGPHFEIPISSTSILRIQTTALIDAKSAFGVPRVFRPDADQKRREASLILRAAVDEIALPALLKLEASLRKSKLAYE